MLHPRLTVPPRLSHQRPDRTPLWPDRGRDQLLTQPRAGVRGKEGELLKAFQTSVTQRLPPGAPPSHHLSPPDSLLLSRWPGPADLAQTLQVSWCSPLTHERARSRYPALSHSASARL